MRQESAIRPPQVDISASAALAWTLVFAAFHVYWFCGGRFGFGDASGPIPSVDSLSGAMFAVVVGAMFAFGGWLPVIILTARRTHLPRTMIVLCIGAGSVLLLLRGTTGLFDQALRETGLAAHGLSGLSYEQLMGDAHPTPYTLWSSVCIDAYFVLGGLLHGVLWLRLRNGEPSRTPSGQRGLRRR